MTTGGQWQLETVDCNRQPFCLSRRILNFARQVKRKLKLKFAIDRDATEDLILDSMKSCDVFEGSKNFQLPTSKKLYCGHWSFHNEVEGNTQILNICVVIIPIPSFTGHGDCSRRP